VATQTLELSRSVVFVGTDEILGMKDLYVEEREQVQNCVLKRQLEFATGRWCMRKAISYLGRPPCPILPGPGREPIMPKNMVGSISHTRGYCCAIAGVGVRGVGVDVEIIDPTVDQEVWKLIYGEQERLKMQAIKGMDPIRGSFAIYSAKETVFKSLYPFVKRYFGFEAAHADIVPTENVIRVTLTQDLSVEFKKGITLDVQYSNMGEFILTTHIH
jgi:enterobactin synthetase component D